LTRTSESIRMDKDTTTDTKEGAMLAEIEFRIAQLNLQLRLTQLADLIEGGLLPGGHPQQLRPRQLRDWATTVGEFNPLPSHVHPAGTGDT